MRNRDMSREIPVAGQKLQVVSIDLTGSEMELLEHIQTENDTDIQKIVSFCLREFLHVYQTDGIILDRHTAQS